MKLPFHFANLIGLILLTSSATAQPRVNHYGAMRTFMMQGDLRSTARMDTLLQQHQHLYGLGVAAGLQGEVMITDGDAIVTRVSPGGKLQTQPRFAGEATLLVTSSVAAWQAYPIPDSIYTVTALEPFISTKANANGVDTTAAFPFRLTGRIVQANWHVMDWPNSAEIHTMQNHKQHEVKGQFLNELVEVLGFFSHQHTGIFIHHSGATHLHVRSMASGLVGHVDSLNPSGMTLHLPVNSPVINKDN
jgi:acetolactate decarboxylase